MKSTKAGKLTKNPEYAPADVGHPSTSLDAQLLRNGAPLPGRFVLLLMRVFLPRLLLGRPGFLRGRLMLRRRLMLLYRLWLLGRSRLLHRPFPLRGWLMLW
jgi:hypothetical protein